MFIIFHYNGRKFLSISYTGTTVLKAPNGLKCACVRSREQGAHRLCDVRRWLIAATVVVRCSVSGIQGPDGSHTNAPFNRKRETASTVIGERWYVVRGRRTRRPTIGYIALGLSLIR